MRIIGYGARGWAKPNPTASDPSARMTLFEWAPVLVMLLMRCRLQLSVKLKLGRLHLTIRWCITRLRRRQRKPRAGLGDHGMDRRYQ